MLNAEYFRILKDYRGDFSDFDLKRAEKFIFNTFSNVVPGHGLKYDNVDDLSSDKLIFATYENEDIETGAVFTTPQYKIEYDKKTKEVYLRLVGRVIPTYVVEEAEIDSIAESIIKKLNYKGILNERTVRNIGVPQLASISYSYINKTDDVWDKRQDLYIEIDAYGLVGELRIEDCDDNSNINFIDINEIADQIQEDANINNIEKIINSDGELEYVLKVNYKDTDYTMVFDGISGNFKQIVKTKAD